MLPVINVPVIIHAFSTYSAGGFVSMTHNLTKEIVICLLLFYYLSIEIWSLYGPSSVAKIFKLEVD